MRRNLSRHIGQSGTGALTDSLGLAHSYEVKELGYAELGELLSPGSSMMQCWIQQAMAIGLDEQRVELAEG